MKAETFGDPELIQRQAEIVSEYAFFEDWLDRYQQMMEEGTHLPAFDESYQTEDYFVKGCQSQVWFYATFKQGQLSFYGKADAAIVQGLLALLIRAYSHATPEAILSTPPRFLDEMGLTAHLSPTRQNGLNAVYQRMLAYARLAQAEGCLTLGNRGG